MIVDDTLREGLQSPGISFKIEEKLKIARLLSDAGIRSALVSYPSAHSSEFEVTKKIVELSFFKEVYGLGRTVEKDIDLICETGANISLHLPFQFDDTAQIIRAIKYASKKDRKLEVAVVDVLQYGEDILMKLCGEIVEAGSDTLQLPDTMGTATPMKFGEIVSRVRSKFPDTTIEVHCHNDRGLSLQNAITGLESGADRIDTSIYGLGERNGITDEITMARFLEEEGYKTGIDQKKIMHAYDYMFDLIMEKVGSKLFADNFPVVGRNVSVHTAGTHASFSKVFQGENYSVNVYTGRSMIRKILEGRGIRVPDNMMGVVVNMVKDQAVDTGKVLNADEIARIAGETVD